MKALWSFLILFALVFAGWFIWDTQQNPPEDVPDPTFLLDRDGDKLWLTLIGGDELEPEHTLVVATIDQTQFPVPAADLGFGETWNAGERVCIIGPGCIAESGDDIDVKVEWKGHSVFFASR